MLSVIIPVFNEEESLKLFYIQLIQIAPSLARSYEIIFVDDGSLDNSLEILKRLAQKDKNIKIFSFRKNQGKAEALTFGFQKAKGDYIVTLDADLQDKPKEIPKLLRKLNEGWDLVCGWRRNRNDSFLKIASSKIFNFMVCLLWGLKLHDYNCGLKAYTKEVAKSLRLYGGMHRFTPLLVHEQGFLVCEQVVEHQKRLFGKSKYGLSKLWRDFPDIFTMLFLSKFSQRPMHFFGIVGLILFIVGIVILSYLTLLWLEGEIIGRRPLLFLGMLLALSGLQVFFTGFLADLMINLSHSEKVKENSKILLRYSSKE